MRKQGYGPWYDEDKVDDYAYKKAGELFHRFFGKADAQ